MDSGRPWYLEALTPDLYQACSVREILYAGRTAYQSIRLMDTDAYGRILVLDGKTQSGEVDEFVYHEALVHPAMLAHPHPRRVFIAGGGEGATLREVLAHVTVEKAVMVDIDGEVVELCKKYLPEYSAGAFENPRAELRLADAAAYLESASEPFDVAILDLPDPLEGGPALKLFTQEFYTLVRDRLTEAGTVGLQTGPAFIGATRGMAAVHATLASVFPHVSSYSTEIYTFGGRWAFALASKGDDPSALTVEEIDRRIAQRISRGLQSYDGLTHVGMFALPKHIRNAMQRDAKISTLAHPLTVS